MKKVLLLIMSTVILTVLLSGCNENGDGNQNSVYVEIGERLFMTQIMDIIGNYDHYIGRTVRYEGVFEKLEYFGDGDPLAFVFRRGPGCCGDDGFGGFMVVWEDNDADFPENDDWVEVVGTFGIVEIDGLAFRSVFLSSLTVLETRGEEFVWS
ncbi:MAG: hypothetical protein FWE29_02215 [Defluviitaleaceae bacterium]|nr:hypothetical protein [Defluviitaleaceae bacterium]